MESDRIVLDSGALSALAEKNRTVRVALARATLNGAVLVVPTAVIAEATKGAGPRDATTNHAIKRSSIILLDHAIARNAAKLRHARRGSGAGTIDAIVVATADALPGSYVLTGDPHDLTALAAVNGRTHVVPLEHASSLGRLRSRR